MTLDPIVAQAFETAKAILSEHAHIDAFILVCELNYGGFTVAFDPPDGHGDIDLARWLRGAADRIEELRE